MIRINLEKIGRILQERGGLSAWLMSRLQLGAQAGEQRKSRLALLDRISLAPQQSLALVEAEGSRFLVGTSAEGGPVFYALDGFSERGRSTASAAPSPKSRAIRTAAALSAGKSSRVSW